jgi:hypothetical protein
MQYLEQFWVKSKCIVSEIGDTIMFFESVG